jgi:glycosyltransferase involved in cell wall biosynthesis
MGGGTRSYEMAKRWVAAGHEVHVYTSRTDGNQATSWAKSRELGVNIHWFQNKYSNKMSFFQRVWAFCRFVIALLLKIKEINGDVVFATSTPLTIAIPAIAISRFNKIPMVFEVRDLWPAIPISIGAIKNQAVIWLAQKLEFLAYKNADQIVALSDGMRDGILSVNGNFQNITVIPNCCDLDLFYPSSKRRIRKRDELNLIDTDFLISYCGTIGEINGVDYLVDVGVMLKSNRNIKILIVGDGKYRENVFKKAVESGCYGKNLFLLQKQSKFIISDILAASDLSVSLFIDLKVMESNSANKFFDVIASGCCVGINYGGWQKSLITEKRIGINLSRNPSEAADQIRRLYLNRDEARAMGSRARLVAETMFPRDKMAQKALDVIERTVKNFTSNK